MDYSKLFGDTGALGGTGSLLTGLGTIYAAYNQNQQARDALNWEKKTYGDSQTKLGQAQTNLDSAVANVYGDGTARKRGLGYIASDYGV